MEASSNKEVTIDISSKKFDEFNIFVTISSFFVEEFYNIINTLNKEKMKKKDKNDLILEDLTYIFG